MGNLASNNLFKKYSFSSIQFKGKNLTERLNVKIVQHMIQAREFDLLYTILKDFQRDILITDRRYLRLLLTDRESTRTGQPSPSLTHLLHLNPLFFAIENDFSAPLLSYIAKVEPSLVFDRDKNGRTVVYYVCKYSTSSPFLDDVKSLLMQQKNGSQLLHEYFLQQDADGWNSIHHAVSHQGASLEVIRWLLKSFPELPQIKTKAGAFPFHLALQAKVSSEILLFLLDEYSDVCHSTLGGNTSLHLACMNRTSPDVIRRIAERYSRNISLVGADSKYPLHCALEAKCDLEVVRYLVQAFPDALSHRDGKGRMPFHYAIEKKGKEELVAFLLDFNPLVASERGRGQPGNLPLSIALDNQLETSSVLRILRAYPKAASVKDIYNLYPLRAAMNDEREIELLTEILEAYPPAAEEVDEHGRLALHYAISRSYPTSFIVALLKAYPNGVKHQDRNGQIPLHLACIRASSLEHITLTREAFEGGGAVLDQYNNVPVNYLLENRARLSLVKAAVNGDASCLREISPKGNIPLHYAIYFLCDYPVVDYLLEVHPEACVYERYEARYTALELAIIRPAPIDVILRVEQTHPKAALHRTSIGYYPLHYALKMKTSVMLVQRLLLTFPDLARESGLPCHTTEMINSSGILTFLDFHAIENARKLEEKVEKRGKKDKESTSPLRQTPGHSQTQTLVESKDVGSTDNLGIKSTQEISPITEVEATDCCQGNRLLLTFAIDLRATQEAVAEIARHTMPYAPGSNVLNKAHHYSWTHLVSHAKDLYAHAVELILDAYSQKEINTLAHFPDEKGFPAISIATYNTHTAILQKLHFQGRYQIESLTMFESDNSLIRRAVDYEGHDNSQHDVVLKFFSDRKCFLNEIKFREKHAIHDRILKDSEMSTVEYKLFQDQRRLEALNDHKSLTIPCVASHNSDEDFTFRDEAAARGFASWPFLLIFPCATYSLRDIILNSNFAGKNYEKITFFCRQILSACHEFHTKFSSCHGNLHPGHLLYLHDKIVLSDLSLAQGCSFPEPVIHEFGHRALAYSSPEVAQVYYEKSRFIPTDETPEYLCTLSASLTQDLWSIGAIFYYLFTGETLFLTKFDSSIDQDQLEILRKWPKFMKDKRMKKIECSIARNLVDQLLSFDPSLRPDCFYCLQHPTFFHEKALGRFVGSEPKNDIFLAYRYKIPSKVDSYIKKNTLKKIKSLVPEDDLVSDSEHAAEVTRLLEACKFTLTDGNAIFDSYTSCDFSDTLGSEQTLLEVAEKSFLDITYHKAMFIFASRFGLNCDAFNLSTLTKISELNLYLFQIRIAIELSSRGLLEGGVYVLAIGDKDEPGILDQAPTLAIQPGQWPVQIPNPGESAVEKPMLYSSFFYHQHSKNDRTTTCLPEHIPNIVLSSLENATSSLLLKYGYGKLHFPKLTLKDMIQKMLQFPIFEVVGYESVALVKSCEDIRCSLSSKFTNKILPLSLSRPPTTSAFSKIIDTNLASSGGFMDNFNGESLTPTTPSFSQKKRNIINFSLPTDEVEQDDFQVVQGDLKDTHKLRKTFSSGSLSRFGKQKQLSDPAILSGINQGLGSGLAFSHPGQVSGASASSQESTSSHLPYFTEVVGLDKAQSESMVKFLVEKMELKESEVKNLNFEIELMQERIRQQQDEIHKLKLLSSVIRPSI